MSLEKELEKYGLDNRKVRVYLATLELGEAKAFDISRKAKIERPTTYDLLGKLVEAGFVSYYEKRGVRYFVAEHPERIISRLDERRRSFQQLVPELLSIYNTHVAKPRIKFYDGIEGIKTVIGDTLTVRNKRLRSILSVVDLFTIPGKKFMDDYVARRVQMKVQLRVLRSRPKEVSEYWPTDPSALRELRYTPAPMVFSMTMYVYDSKVSLVSSKKENFGMIIESEEFAQNFGHLFEALWQLSQPV